MFLLRGEELDKPMQNNIPLDPCVPLYTGKRSLDLLILNYMRKRVQETIPSIKIESASQSPLVYALHERHARIHRIVLYRSEELSRCTELAFVGFISRKRGDLDASTMHEIHMVDKALVAEMVENTGILCYSSLELRTGIWFNLVVMSSKDATARVLHMETHAYAAYQLAPRYYTWIRLHTGIMHYGFFSEEMEIVRTRYYTFHAPHTRPTIQEQCYTNERISS